MEPLSDEALLQQIASGNEDSLGVLYDRFGRRAYSLAYRILGDHQRAEDVVQDAFLNVWRKAASFDTQRGSAQSWLLTVVHHKAIDACRRQRGQPAKYLPLESAETLPAPDGVWQELANTLDREALERALARIPPEQREAIQLAYFGGYTHREIADLQQVPLGTAKGRIRIGMDKLRELLAPWQQGGPPDAP